MKKLLLLLILCKAALCGAAADSTTVAGDSTGMVESMLVRDDAMMVSTDGTACWHRYKKARTWAWTLAGLGCTAALTGIVGKAVDKSTNMNYSAESNRHWNIPIFGGMGVAAASIPFFIMAHNAKGCAVRPASTPVVTIVKDKTREKALKTVARQNRYWRRHKTFKTCAWTSLGVGVAAMGVGFVGAVACAMDDSNSDGRPFGICFYSGAAMSFGSIPLFVQAYRNKYKSYSAALDVTLNATSIPAMSQRGFAYNQPAMGLSLNF